MRVVEVGEAFGARGACVVNPAHLEAVSLVENVRRSSATKLTERDVAEIRAAGPGVMHAELAERYGVTESTICGIRKGRGWAGVGDAA